MTSPAPQKPPLLANFTLRQLSYFVGAAEAGTTAAAAQRFYLSQSSMSAALTELEAALGVQLFIRRRGKGLELTATGLDLLPEARHLVRAAEEFNGRAGALQHQLTGRLMVGCFATIAPLAMPPLLEDFAARYLEVEIDFLEAGQDELQQHLLAGRIELAVMYDFDLAPQLESRHLYRPVPHVLVPRGHQLAGRDEVALAEIAEEPFIMIETDPARPLTLQTFTAAGLTPRIRFASENFDHIRALVHRGMGYAMISHPRGIIPAHWNDGVSAVPISDPSPPTDVAMVSVASTKMTLRARTFRDFSVEHVKRAVRRALQ